jgi:hypothetical protein
VNAATLRFGRKRSASQSILENYSHRSLAPVNAAHRSSTIEPV